MLAQTSSRTSLVVTVVDPSGAVLPEASVTVAGVEDDTKAMAPRAAKTTSSGAVTFSGLAPGRYSLHAEFPGFEPGTVPDVRVARGDNKQTIVLRIENVAESVTVARDSRSAGADRAANAFGLTVNAGADCRRCPTTRRRWPARSTTSPAPARSSASTASRASSCRRSRRSSRSTSPATSSPPRPSSRARPSSTSSRSRASARFAGTGNLSFRDGSMSAKSQFTPTKGPEQNVGYGFNVGGAVDQAEEQLLAGGQRPEPVHHAEPERRDAGR